jgi:hypothetical protein
MHTEFVWRHTSTKSFFLNAILGMHFSQLVRRVLLDLF